MQKTSRFIRRNAVDYLFIIIPILLLVALLGRAVSLHFFGMEEKRYTAEIGFVIRSVDSELLEELLGEPTRDFSMPGGAVLKDARVSSYSFTKEVVADGNGNFVELESKDRYDVTFTVGYASGGQAKDGTFLLGGVKRLSVGDSMNLTCKGAEYPVDFVKVRILD